MHELVYCRAAKSALLTALNWAMRHKHKKILEESVNSGAAKEQGHILGRTALWSRTGLPGSWGRTRPVRWVSNKGSKGGSSELPRLQSFLLRGVCHKLASNPKAQCRASSRTGSFLPRGAIELDRGPNQANLIYNSQNWKYGATCSSLRLSTDLSKLLYHYFTNWNTESPEVSNLHEGRRSFYPRIVKKKKLLAGHIGFAGGGGGETREKPMPSRGARIAVPAQAR